MDARLRLTSQRNRQAHQQWWRWSLCVCLLLCGGLTGCANLGKSDGAYAAAKPSLFGGKKNKVILDPELGFEDYDIAVASYEAQDYSQAEKQLKSIIKKFEDYPVEEDARFLLAESRTILAPVIITKVCARNTPRPGTWSNRPGGCMPSALPG